VSQPPEYPGRQRMKRAAAAAGSDAYQGAFEAVGSVLIACAFGYWVDSRWETAPYGLLLGTLVGFAAMVLRLIRLGKELHPDTEGTNGSTPGDATSDVADDLGVGESPGMSSVLRHDDADERGNGKTE
jgi:F0F1-type ATP synthase assembly protein I